MAAALFPVSRIYLFIFSMHLMMQNDSVHASARTKCSVQKYDPPPGITVSVIVGFALTLLHILNCCHVTVAHYTYVHVIFFLAFSPSLTCTAAKAFSFFLYCKWLNKYLILHHLSVFTYPFVKIRRLVTQFILSSSSRWQCCAACVVGIHCFTYVNWD